MATNKYKRYQKLGRKLEPTKSPSPKPSPKPKPKMSAKRLRTLAAATGPGS